MPLPKYKALLQSETIVQMLISIALPSPDSMQWHGDSTNKSGSAMNVPKVVTLIEERDESGELSSYATACYTADGDLRFEAEYRRVGHLAKFDEFDVQLSITVPCAQSAALCRALGNPYDMLFVIKQRFSGERFWTISSFLREHHVEYSRWISSTTNASSLCQPHRGKFMWLLINRGEGSSGMRID